MQFFQFDSSHSPRIISTLALAACMSFSFTACLADLRPEALQSRSGPTDSEQARAILNAGAAAQTIGDTSRASWLASPGIRVHMTDEWFGLADVLVNNWPENPQHIDFQFLPGRDAGVMNFLRPDGAPTGVSWGIHEWNAWKRASPEAPADYTADGVIKFSLPTVQYFLEMAMRLPDSGIADFAGTTEVDGVPLNVAYVTWNSYGANSKTDQYVAYYQKDNGRLHHVEFTVRDQMPFITAAAYYTDYRAVQGYYVPFTIDITDVGDPTSVVHRYRIQEVQLNYELKRAGYAPDARRAPGTK